MPKKADVRVELEGALKRVRDLEEQLGLKSVLIDTETIFKVTLEQTFEGLQILDHHYTYIYVNQVAASQGMSSKQELIGHKIVEKYPGIEKTDFFAVLQSVMNQRIPHTMENLFEYPSGKKVWFELFIEPHPVGVLIRSVDISQRKQVEAQYQHSQKMEAIGLLAGGVAHDFNNKLGIMMLFCEMIEDLLSPEQKRAREYLQNVYSAVNDSARLTKQLLACGRKQVLDLKVANLNDVIVSKQDSLPRMLGETVRVVFHLDKELPNVRIDVSQMDQVLINLCLNARDAMPSGGTLTIETGSVDLDSEYCRLRPEVVPGRYVVISVSDNGIGMTPEIKERIFEPFFTTKSKGMGTGLGLPSVYGIVNQSRGHIWVYSEPDVGSTFKLYFPQVLESVDPVQLEEKDTLEYAGNETILLIEDDIMLSQAFYQTLQGAGYSVLVANDGDEARKLFADNQQKIDLLLTDVILPKVKGSQLAAEFIKQAGTLKVVYISGYTENSIVHNGVLDTDSILLQKPLTSIHLLKTLRAVLDGQHKKGVF